MFFAKQPKNPNGIEIKIKLSNGVDVKIKLPENHLTVLLTALTGILMLVGAAKIWFQTQ